MSEQDYDGDAPNGPGSSWSPMTSPRMGSDATEMAGMVGGYFNVTLGYLNWCNTGHTYPFPTEEAAMRFATASGPEYVGRKQREHITVRDPDGNIIHRITPTVRNLP